MTRTQPLFRSIGTDGATYLFVIESDQRWTIRRDENVIASGPSDDRGIREAITVFRALPLATRERPAHPRRKVSTARPPHVSPSGYHLSV